MTLHILVSVSLKWREMIIVRINMQSVNLLQGNFIYSQVNRSKIFPD